MSENLKCLKTKNEGEGKKQSNKDNETTRSSLLEKTQIIDMPSNKKKIDIGKLLPFNIQGNKTELLANNIGGLVEKAASRSDRIIDAFGGTGAYIHYLRDSGNDKPMLLNELDPYRFVTHRQMKDNPLGVSIVTEYYMDKLKKMVDQFKDGEKFGPAAKATQKDIVALFQKEAERLIEPGQNLTESYKHNLPVKMKNTPEVAGLYIVMQSQRFGYRPIQADATPTGLKPVMGSGELETIGERNKTIRKFWHGKSFIFDSRERIKSASLRYKGVKTTNGDGWKLIRETAGKRDFIIVDTSCLGKSTSNYNKLTQEDSDHNIYIEKIDKYIKPAADRGAKFMVTNNWDDEIANKYQKIGFSIFKTNRKKRVSRDTTELIAINFDPNTGYINSTNKSFNKVHFSSTTVEWSTPQGVFNNLDDEFGFTLDPCATHENAKCKKYFTQAEDGLKQDWGTEKVFMNPPYGRVIGGWMKKAYESSLNGATVVCLIPARTDTRWFHEYAIKGEVRAIKGRLKFGDAKNSAPFPSAIVIFRPSEDDVKIAA